MSRKSSILIFFCLALSLVADTHGSDCRHHGTRKKSGQIRARIHKKKHTQKNSEHKHWQQQKNTKRKTKNELTGEKQGKKQKETKRNKRGAEGLEPVSPLTRAKSGKTVIFKLRGVNLCTSHILVFGCLHGQDVDGSVCATVPEFYGFVSKINFFRFVLAIFFHGQDWHWPHGCVRFIRYRSQWLCLPSFLFIRDFFHFFKCF